MTLGVKKDLLGLQRCECRSSMAYHNAGRLIIAVLGNGGNRQRRLSVGSVIVHEENCKVKSLAD